MRTFRKIPMPFLALNGAVLPASIKMIGEPYFCYYRLLPQVARTYLCTRNLSDSPFLEKGGLRTIHPTCMQLALPSPWCCTTVWLVFSGRTRMQGTTPPGSVQPSGNMTPSLKKIGEPFFPHYRLSPQIGQPCFRTRHSYISTLQ